LISPRHYLTAAHCVCGNGEWYSPDAAQCVPALDRLTLQVFFPSVGLVDVVSKPIVHKDYRSAREAIEADKTIVADLAIIELERSVSLPVAVLGKAIGSERPLMSSFGTFSFTSLPRGSSFIANIEYQDGVQQVSKQRNLTLEVGACGDIAAADTYCTEYNEQAVRAGPLQDAGACGGDSGAPLYRRHPVDGHAVLIGITSYYSQGNIGDCISGRLTHFVNLESYAEWIEDEVSEAEKSEPRAFACADAILQGPALFPIKTGRSVLSLTTFEQTGASHRPDLSLVGVTLENCRSAKEFGVVSCSLAQPTLVQVILGSGFAQLSICSSDDSKGGTQ
jgi:secreted trypsin-like serine protease